MIKIYGKKESRAVRCLWALEELGLPYEHVSIDSDGNENRTAAYLALNPSGKIPTLVEDDFILTESMAITFYLASKKPGMLMPSDLKQQATAWKWSLWAATEAEFHISLIVRELRKTSESADQKRISESMNNLSATLLVLESHLEQGGDYLVLDSFCIADLNTASVICYLDMIGFKREPFPKTSAWLERCLSRPAWLAVQN